MKYDKNHALLESFIPGVPAPKQARCATCMIWAIVCLLVATDRISAFDVVMPNGIPDKGGF